MSRDLENKDFNDAIALLEKSNYKISEALRAYLNKKETWQLRAALSKLHVANCTLPKDLCDYICNHEKNTLLEFGAFLEKFLKIADSTSENKQSELDALAFEYSAPNNNAFAKLDTKPNPKPLTADSLKKLSETETSKSLHIRYSTIALGVGLGVIGFGLMLFAAALFASSYGTLFVPSALIFAKGAHLMATSAGLFVTGGALSAASASCLFAKKQSDKQDPTFCNRSLRSSSK